MELDHSLPTEGAGGFRTAWWNLVLLEAQSQAPDFQAAQLQADEDDIYRVTIVLKYVRPKSRTDVGSTLLYA